MQAARAIALLGVLMLSNMHGGPADAQVPLNLAQENRAIGKRIDTVATASLYGPLAEQPPYIEARATPSIVFSFNTTDRPVSDAVLNWIRSVR